MPVLETRYGWLEYIQGLLGVAGIIELKSQDKIQVMVIDDSAYYRQALIQLLERSPRIEVIGTASDGIEAIRFLARTKPDVITLDLEMPGIDGFTFFRWLMKNNPIPTLVVSSIAGGPDALKALDMGAVDFVAKPARSSTMKILEIEKELIQKIAAVAHIPVERLMMRSMMTEESVDAGEDAEESSGQENATHVVTIGASTGGPSAVHKVLGDLNRDFPLPILISQHMPAGFTSKFATRLNNSTKIKVKEAETGDLLKPGQAYVCPGGRHIELYNESSSGKIYISLLTAEPDALYVPSVDIMMSSAVSVFKDNVLGVILTGMGYDGLEGMKAIKKADGHTIAESSETALIYGMPKAVIDHGITDTILPLQAIGRELVKYSNSL